MGAYAVGVMKALFSGQSPATAYQPLEPHIFAGTSVGAFNAAFLVAQWDVCGPKAIENLEDVWRNTLSESSQTCGNGVFRLRGDPATFVNPWCFLPNPLRPLSQFAQDGAALSWDYLRRATNLVTSQTQPLLERLVELFNFSSFVSRAPLQQTLQDTIRFADIRTAQKALRIVATNWQKGSLQVFANAEMTDRIGPLAIAASSAIPGFFPPTEIEGEPFVDGGVLLNTPLKPAIDAGADILHVIYLDLDIRNIPLAHMSNTLETLYRMQTIEWAKALGNDIAAARRINHEVAMARWAAGAMDGLSQGLPPDLLGGIPRREVEQWLEGSRQYRPLTIYCYHPRDDLGGALGLIDFDRHRIQQIIERGFNDAVAFQPNICEVIQPPQFLLDALPQPNREKGDAQRIT